MQRSSSAGLASPGVGRQELGRVRESIPPGDTATFDMPTPLTRRAATTPRSCSPRATSAKASLALSLRMPDYYRADYGHQLTLDGSSSDAAAVWWCDATRKVAAAAAAARGGRRRGHAPRRPKRPRGGADRRPAGASRSRA